MQYHTFTYVWDIFVVLTSIFQVFQEEIQGKGVCLEFTETVDRETIVRDARRTALTIQAATARVILIFCWYTDTKKIFLELAKINVRKWHENLSVQMGACCENRISSVCIV